MPHCRRVVLPCHPLLLHDFPHRMRCLIFRIFVKPTNHDRHQRPEVNYTAKSPHDCAAEFLIAKLRESPLLPKPRQSSQLTMGMGVDRVIRCIRYAENYSYQTLCNSRSKYIDKCDGGSEPAFDWFPNRPPQNEAAHQECQVFKNVKAFVFYGGIVEYR